MNLTLTIAPRKVFFLVAFTIATCSNCVLSQASEKPKPDLPNEERVICNSKPILEVAQVLAKWYKVKIYIDNRDILEYAFTGIIKRERGLSSNIKMLEMCFGLQGYYKDGALHLKLSAKSASAV